MIVIPVHINAENQWQMSEFLTRCRENKIPILVGTSLATYGSKEYIRIFGELNDFLVYVRRLIVRRQEDEVLIRLMITNSI